MYKIHRKHIIIYPAHKLTNIKKLISLTEHYALSINQATNYAQYALVPFFSGGKWMVSSYNMPENSIQY